MGEACYRVELTFTAALDLEEIDSYWTEQGEPWRGEKYFRDLKELAQREPSAARVRDQGASSATVVTPRSA